MRIIWAIHRKTDVEYQFAEEDDCRRYAREHYADLGYSHEVWAHVVLEAGEDPNTVEYEYQQIVAYCLTMGLDAAKALCELHVSEHRPYHGANAIAAAERWLREVQVAP